MGYAARKLQEQVNLTLIMGSKQDSTANNKLFSVPTRRILLLGVLLAMLQIADGVLTGMGMHIFGTNAEGNILLRFLMEEFGFVTALVVTKTIALGIIAMLCVLAARVSWLPYAMKGVIAIYLLAAIIPWSYILLSHA